MASAPPATFRAPEQEPALRPLARPCAALGIRVPRLEDAMSSASANYYSLIVVVLLERGAPTTLDEVAVRFEEAGVASACDALASPKRCKPARAPIHRDGDHYALDPHDDEVGFWLFRLGLRSPRFALLHAVRPAPGPLPPSDVPLTIASLEEAWRQGIPMAHSEAYAFDVQAADQDAPVQACLGAYFNTGSRVRRGAAGAPPRPNWEDERC